MLPVASSFVNGAGKAAARGVDLRLFYDDGAEAVQGCLRFGPGAQGGRDASLIVDMIHGGCIETCLHECMLEALKLGEDPEAVLVDFRAEIKLPHRQDETYRVEAVCRLPEKGDEDDDDDDDLGKAVLFSDTGMKQRPVAATIFERC
ncbi:hypothetical protein JL722_11285 [Aureococcus anophagefferens]|nr:hypothetical protein JL722_11285 [Aureococcus anophagefferens]